MSTNTIRFTAAILATLFLQSAGFAGPQLVGPDVHDMKSANPSRGIQISETPEY
ncbi:MAG TPA: hypothetical protein VF798_12025 [Burkholderiaceae bacterium]